MKKALSYICIIIGLFLLFAGTSRWTVGYMWNRKRHEMWWGEHQNNYGDLTKISYLDDIKIFQTPKDYTFTKPADSSSPKNIDLYLWGDSYTEDIPTFAFAHVNAYHYGRNRHGGLGYKLDKTRRNILILETAERYVRSDYGDFGIYTLVKKKEKATSLAYPIVQPMKNYALLGVGIKMDDLFNPNINQNLEYLLFNLNLMNPPRKLKANLNYYCFNRGSGNAVIAKDGQHLFLKETVEPNSIYSSYEPFSDTMASRYAANLAQIYQHYLAEGFDEVYFAIIPNPATLLQPANYNNLIPVLENHPARKIPVISLYTQLKQSPGPRQYFRAGDTHWNNKGIQMWLAMVNEILAQESKKGLQN